MAAKKKTKRAVSRKPAAKASGMVDHETFLLTLAGAVFLALVIILIF